MVLTSHFVLLQDHVVSNCPQYELSVVVRSALLGTFELFYHLKDHHLLPSSSSDSSSSPSSASKSFSSGSLSVRRDRVNTCGRWYAKHKSVSFNEALWEKSSYLQQEPLIWWTPETQQPLKQLQDFCERKTIRVQNEQT